MSAENTIDPNFLKNDVRRVKCDSVNGQNPSINRSGVAGIPVIALKIQLIPFLAIRTTPDSYYLVK